MRIIGGKHSKKRIIAPSNLPVRPTTDMAKEALFNILDNYIYFEDVSVLDLFAGSGALGFEAASRGAAKVDMVDTASSAIKQLHNNNTTLGFESINIHRTTAQQYIQKSIDKYDLIFLDPPFDSDELNTISAIIHDCAAPDALLYREYRKNQEINSMNPDIWTLHKQKTAGQVCFELWKRI